MSSEYSSADNIETYKIFQRQAFTLEQEVVDKDDEPVDCSGATDIKLWAYRDYDDDTNLIEKVFTDFTVTGADDNLLQCQITRANSNLYGVIIVETLITLTADTKELKTVFKLDLGRAPN